MAMFYMSDARGRNPRVAIQNFAADVLRRERPFILNPELELWNTNPRLWTKLEEPSELTTTARRHLATGIGAIALVLGLSVGGYKFADGMIKIDKLDDSAIAQLLQTSEYKALIARETTARIEVGRIQAQKVKMIEEAQSSGREEARITRRVNRIAGIFGPIVLIGAALLYAGRRRESDEDAFQSDMIDTTINTRRE